MAGQPPAQPKNKKRSGSAKEASKTQGSRTRQEKQNTAPSSKPETGSGRPEAKPKARTAQTNPPGMPRVDKDQHNTNEEANKRKTRAKAREMESARVEEKENMKDKNKAKAPTKPPRWNKMQIVSEDEDDDHDDHNNRNNQDDEDKNEDSDNEDGKSDNKDDEDDEAPSEREDLVHTDTQDESQDEDKEASSEDERPPLYCAPRKPMRKRMVQRKPRKPVPARGTQERYYYDAGHCIARTIDPFVNISAIVTVTVAIAVGTRKITEQDMPYLERMNRIVQLAPEFDNLFPNEGDDDQSMDPMWTAVYYMEKGMKKARETDTSHLNAGFSAFAPFDPDNESITPPFPTTKKLRGMKHTWIRQWLCPVDKRNILYSDEYFIDPSLPLRELADVQRRDYQEYASTAFRTTAQELPSFLYDLTMLDPDDPEAGMYHSYIHLRATRYLYTGPGSAVTGNRVPKARASVAKLMGIDSVSPEIIAYSACQLRFILSESKEWSILDGDFDYSEFFNMIVRYLRADDDPSVEAILKWWNENMFWGMDETAMETDTRKKRPHDPDASANKVLAAQEERIKRRRLKGSTSAPPSDDVQ